MIDPLARYSSRPYGAEVKTLDTTTGAGAAVALDPLSAVTGAIGAVFSTAAEVAKGIVGAKQTRDAQIAAVAAVNPCVARVQAQIATLGPKPVWYVTEQQKKERDLRRKYEDRLRALLANPMLCPEVAANEAARNAQEAANAQAAMGYYTIGAVGILGAGALIYLARRKKT